MPRKARIDSSAALRHVGLYLDERVDADAGDVAAVRGVSKSAVYATGVRRVLDELTPDERKALDAMRAARRSAP
jgi:hypothetical protein